MPKYVEQHSISFKKRLADLTPPAFRLETPHDRFTADLHRLNSYFWSTEVALATTLSSYSQFEDSPEPANRILEKSRANAFKPATNSRRPHYSAKMGSLLVQLRWNYDALGRHVLIEAVAIAEAFSKELLGELPLRKVPSSFERQYEHLQTIGVRMNALTAFRAQMYKLLRNHVVHERSTLHTFSSGKLRQATEAFARRARTWDSTPGWPADVEAAMKEVLVTTRLASKAIDLPQLFIVAIYCLSRVSEFGSDLNVAVKNYHVSHPTC